MCLIPRDRHVGRHLMRPRDPSVEHQADGASETVRQVVPYVDHLNRVREEEQHAQQEESSLENRDPKEGIMQLMLNYK